MDVRVDVVMRSGIMRVSETEVDPGREYDVGGRSLCINNSEHLVPYLPYLCCMELEEKFKVDVVFFFWRRRLDLSREGVHVLAGSV
jgi:hypothetical protein